MPNNRQSTGKFWLTKRPDSPVWYVATYDPVKRKTVLRSTKTTEEAAAQKVLAGFILGHDIPQQAHSQTATGAIEAQPAAVTLACVLDEYLASIARQPSAEQARYTRAHMVSHFGEDFDVRLLNFDKQEAYLDHRIDAGVKASTVERELSVLRAALYHFSEQCPHVLPVPPKIYNPEREDNSRKRWLTPEELAALLNATKSPHIRLFILLGITTGARPDAILDLKWDAIDFNAMRIYLNPNGRAQNAKHRPVMPLQDVLWAELRQAWENEVELAQFWRSRNKGRPTSGYVVSYGGYPLGSIKKAFARTVEAAGLGKDVVPYSLRHTAASWLAQAGVPLVEIAAFLGHSDTRMVEQHYVHLHPDYKEKAANTIAENMKKAGITPQLRPREKRGKKGDAAKSRKAMVGVTGIEPVTPSMSTKCSPAELHAHCHSQTPAAGASEAAPNRHRRPFL
tara:strand:+ start:39843 stop:41198 length:1356 start_codon:yes stop_codon:yes gene_type:complete